MQLRNIEHHSDEVRRLGKRGRGGVINVASEMALQPMPYFASYAASKAFVLSFSEALAEEFRGSGVRITAIAPGFVRTEFADIARSRRARARFRISRLSGWLPSPFARTTAAGSSRRLAPSTPSSPSWRG